jgi:site-specific DNA-adenine methylase
MPEISRTSSNDQIPEIGSSNDSKETCSFMIEDTNTDLFAYYQLVTNYQDDLTDENKLLVKKKRRHMIRTKQAKFKLSVEGIDEN